MNHTNPCSTPDSNPHADPQAALTRALQRAIAAAFGDEFAQTDPILRPAQNPRFGDFQANAAMGLAKMLGKPPREVASAIVNHFDAHPLTDVPKIAGPGFINLKLTQQTLEQTAQALSQHARLGLDPLADPPLTIVDYSSPNVAKEMHVGHIRSTVIGDAIARTLAYLYGPDSADHVIRQNHLGDWGTQFGMLIEHLTEMVPGEKLNAEDFSIADLNEFYQAAKKHFDADPDFADRARKRVVALQGGDAESNRLWEALRIESLQHFDKAYHLLDVLLTQEDICAESFYNPYLNEVVDELAAKNLLAESDGATCVFLDEFKGEEDKPLPLIVRKSDGGFLYATTDLAAIRYRTNQLHAERIIYVTDARQKQHFGMVFAAARLAGFAPAETLLEHVAFGTILGPDNKPFKTREGTTVRLADLLDEAVQRAADAVAQKNPDLSENERAEIARVVGIGAIKYADLSSDRVKDYVFSFDRMLALEGNTAPYLQYAYARIRSILRKAEEQSPAAASVIEKGGSGGESPFVIEHDAERALVLKVAQFAPTVRSVADSLEPHRMCNWLYELAAAFSTFYENCPVLRADSPRQQSSRLALCNLTANALKQGLDLLGIRTLERM